MRVVRSPARPCRSIAACHNKNSSAVSVYRRQASSRESKPPRTAATTWALRRMTQRFVSGGGKSAIVNGPPSGPITYFELGPSVPLILRTLRRRKNALTDFTQVGRKLYGGPVSKAGHCSGLHVI